jgi:SpoIID/LytB domain protein
MPGFKRLSLAACGAGALALAALLAGRGPHGRADADETSTGDKLRILYSSRFTFDDTGSPLITIELMSGQSEVRLSADSGLMVLPDGDGGAVIDAAPAWTVRAEGARPAVIQEWTVVERLGPEDDHGVEQAVALWKQRGFDPHRFEVGSVFGIDGAVHDSREVLVGVAPAPRGAGAAMAAKLGATYQVETSVYPELVRRPQGVLIARGGSTTIRNPSVIWFRPRHPVDTVILQDVVTERGGSQLVTHKETRRYFGSVYVTLDSDGALVAVNAISADKMLAGLVPAEMFPDAPEEALLAQAIAARTDLLQKIGTRHLTDPYLLCSSQHCQVYAGAGHEHPRTTRAVERTRGQVLVRDGGGLVDARYSADCGGHGESSQYIWGIADPSLRGAVDGPPGGSLARAFAAGVGADALDRFLRAPDEDAFCGATKWSKGRHRWTERFTAAQLSGFVAKEYPNLGTVVAVEAIDRGVSGRIGKVRVRGTGATVLVTGDLHIRRTLGGLKSTLFSVEPVGDPAHPDAFVFRGAGFGHGVGMCQLGAIGMAERRYDHKAILEHYYPGSDVRRLY